MRIGTIIPNALDSTSWYRGIGPLNHIEFQEEEIEFLHLQGGNINHANLTRLSGMFLQRPYKKEHLEIILFCKELGVPVWVDYDDYMFDVPKDNPTYFTYMTGDTRKIVAECINNSDVVTVSTDKMKEMFQRKLKSSEFGLNKRVYVVKNGLLPEQIIAPNGKQEKIITWRGTSTHQADIASVAQEIVQVANANKDWQWHFIGYIPWMIVDAMPKDKVTCSNMVPIDKFQSYLNKQKPAIHIVPLERNLFNECKSNIAWLEATLAGAAVLAPEMKEWDQPGLVRYSSTEEFGVNLQKLIQGYDDPIGNTNISLFNKVSFDVIKRDFNLDELNLTRIKIIYNLHRTRLENKKNFNFKMDWPPGGEPKETIMELD